MELGGDRRMLLVGLVAVLVILGALAYFLFQTPTETAEVPTIDSGPDVSAEVSGAVETPAEKIPETNPFKGYKNPFE